MKSSGTRNPKSGFTLVEILVAMGVFVILGTALVGMMAAAVDAWRRGEAGRLVNERVQTLQRQIADDLAAAVLDQPPPPDFHFALDTLDDLSTTAGDPYAILDTSLSSGVSDYVRKTSDGRDLTYFAPSAKPGTATVVLRIRVPFIIGAALLQARTDVFDKDSTARILVACNDATLEPPADQDPPPDAQWKQVAYVEGEGLGGGETDVSRIFRNADNTLRPGNIVFVKVVLDNKSTTEDGAQFLRSDRMRAGGRPVLILDCYRDPNALPQQPRPTFASWVRNGAQIITFTRTLPPDVEQAAAKNAGSPNSTEYLNYAADSNNGKIDEGHRPVAGRAQVVYTIRPYVATLGKQGLGVLRRAFEAPLRQPADDVVDRVHIPNVITMVQEIVSQDFTPHVLHLGMSFWGADTTTWEDRPDLEPDYATKYDGTTTPYPRAASTEWLSSRYLPEQVQVTVVLEPDRGKRATTGLAGGIGANDFPAADEAPLGVVSTQSFDAVQRPSAAFVRDPRHFIKIDDEWLFYSRVGSPIEFIIPRQGSDGLAARGARGTKPAPHAIGAEIYRGITSIFTVRLPAYHHWER